LLFQKSSKIEEGTQVNSLNDLCSLKFKKL